MNIEYHVIGLPEGNVYQHAKSFNKAAVVAKDLIKAGIILNVEIQCVDVDNNIEIGVWRPCYGKSRRIVAWEEEII